jgi:IMP dehydrogenase
MALAGGLGVIHRNQSTKAQAEMVRSVKRFLHGKIPTSDLATLSPESTISDWYELARSRGSESLSVPITEDGKVGGKLVGLVTARDAGSTDDPQTQLSHVMVTDLVTAKASLSEQDAHDCMRSEKKGKLLLVDDAGGLVAMVARSDWKKASDYPLASRDANGQLLVAASIGMGEKKRAQATIEAGVNLLFVDVNVADIEPQVEFVRQLKDDHPRVAIAVGLVSSTRLAKLFIDAGADIIRAGDTCPQLGCGGEMRIVGRGDATAVFNVSRLLSSHYNLPVIADGCFQNSGHVFKAFCLGASAVSITDALLGTDEAFQRDLTCDNDRSQLSWNSRFSGAAKQKPLVLPKYSDSSGRIVASTGPARKLVHYMGQCVKQGLQDVGVQNLSVLHRALHKGELRMECRCMFAAQIAQARRRAVETTAYPAIMPVIAQQPDRVHSMY